MAATHPLGAAARAQPAARVRKGVGYRAHPVRFGEVSAKVRICQSREWATAPKALGEVVPEHRARSATVTLSARLARSLGACVVLGTHRGAAVGTRRGAAAV